jgi:uncharacterized membrane protein YphA (DoxX/SURF4 family)
MKINWSKMKIIRYISRIITGIVFVFSGTVKAIDPLGTVYKFQDYFQAFHIGFLKDISLPLAILLCTFEFIAGFCVLFNIRQKTGIWMVMILMAVFTPLTFVLALTNPVSDCGCFGDAIHLTNWQTFFKNIILLVPAVYLFITRKEILPHSGIIREQATLSIMTLIFILFIFYNLRYLPVIDFLPYRTGTYIPGKMVVPEGKPVDKYQTTLVYEKDGLRKEFEISNYPAGDSTWRFVSQKSVLVSKGYQPPIHDLSFTSLAGEDLTQQILSSQRYTLLMIARKLHDCDPELLKKGSDLGNKCIGSQLDFYVVTSSSSDEAGNYFGGLNVCLADETTLKTMMRSDPGYLLLKDGTIKGKWSWANVPDIESLDKLTANNK